MRIEESDLAPSSQIVLILYTILPKIEVYRVMRITS